jgi:hypothetical protein
MQSILDLGSQYFFFIQEKKLKRHIKDGWSIKKANRKYQTECLTSKIYKINNKFETVHLFSLFLFLQMNILCYSCFLWIINFVTFTGITHQQEWKWKIKESKKDWLYEIIYYVKKNNNRKKRQLFFCLMYFLFFIAGRSRDLYD